MTCPSAKPCLLSLLVCFLLCVSFVSILVYNIDSNEMAPSTVMTLPAEIRHVIYTYVIPEEVHLDCCPNKDEHSYLEVHPPYMSQGIRDVHRQQLSLLLTSKKINEEVS